MASNTSLNRKNPFLNFVKSILFFKHRKTHDFRRYKKGADYSVDFSNFYSSAHMVTGINVNKGEYVILTDGDFTLKYLVETVDYYSNSDSLREIGLKRILQETDEK